MVVDPEGAASVAEFAALLSQARDEAGNPPLRAIAARMAATTGTEIGPSTLVALFPGDQPPRLPTADQLDGLLYAFEIPAADHWIWFDVRARLTTPRPVAADRATVSLADSITAAGDRADKVLRELTPEQIAEVVPYIRVKAFAKRLPGKRKHAKRIAKVLGHFPPAFVAKVLAHSQRDAGWYLLQVALHWRPDFAIEVLAHYPRPDDFADEEDYADRILRGYIALRARQLRAGAG
ncbi:hypothetical protein JOD54_006301 [Actinokineospora baliensis]|uniref:hypothetical protein n=1 Tax=Actinokineospora baliensis TaxID=547056 RepID=UPI00195615ED|nr:hypothetical protein [Actinokineospora baliensis]MBM7776097.1 hypothetical protein [Actinokineospora baliensis]